MNNFEISHLKVTRRRAIGLIGLGVVAFQLPIGCIGDQSKTDYKQDEPIHYKTIAEISEMIKSKQISSVELTQSILNRIAILDGELNSYITVMDQSALDSAKELDNELESGKYRGPLHGVPIAVKDLLFTNNAPTTGGHAFRSEYVPPYSATVVNRLQDSGAVIIGKLNLCEGAWSGYHPDFKIPVNPWGPFWPGESSSGSGVATAAGLCFGSIGTDTGGSIRTPSLVNGIVGLKPTYGLVSRYGVLPCAKSMDHVGPMTRSTEDAAIMLQAIAGYDPNDPTSLQVAVPDILGTLKMGIKGIRIGIDDEYISEGVENSLLTSIKTAIDELVSLGAEIVPVKIPGNKDERDNAGYTINSKEATYSHTETYPSRKSEYGIYFREFLDHGHSITEDEYTSAIRYREIFTKQFRKLFSEVDVIAAPAGGIATALPEKVNRGPMAGWDPYLQDIDWHFAILANLAGTPALTIPCGEAKEGPPPGFQLMGDRLSESILCRVGYAFEKATEWSKQHPNI